MMPGIAGILRGISSIDGIENISLSTNGVFLAGLARHLAGAGLKRINISLDTLRAERFKAMTGAGSFHQIMKGLRAALAEGLHPVKLNVVVIRGMNDDEVPDFIRLTREIPVHVRFIELMPVGETSFFSRNRWVPISEIRQRSGPLEPVPEHQKPEGSGPAIYFRSPGALGTVGFIGALSDNFCRRCNRIRLTSTGKLLSCLAQRAEGADLGAMMRSGKNPEEIKIVIQGVIMSKPESHQMNVCPHPLPRSRKARKTMAMCAVGG